MANFFGRRIRLRPPFVSSSPEESVLSAGVSLEQQTLWFGAIDLHEDSLLISGWKWTGPVQWRIPLEEVQLVERWTVLKGPNFVFHTDSGALHCRIDAGAWHWEQALKEDPRIELKMRS